MVRNVLKFLGQKTETLHAAAYILGIFALLSQILAFLRDRLLAHIFGASSDLDIYYAAFRIPDFIFVTVASIVSISVLVPFIVEREKESREAVREFVSNISSFFAVLMIITCAVAFFLIPELSSVLFKGFTEQKLDEAIFLSRLLLISPLALGFSNLLGSLTQAYNRFTIYALAPLLYNTGIIVGILAFAQGSGVRGVAYGVVIGALLHVLVQIPFVIREELFPRFTLRFNFSSIKRVVGLSLPRTLTLSANHLSLLFLISLASLMASGSISILSFSNNLQAVPLTIIGVSYSLAAFPTLTRHFADRNISAFLTQMATTTRHIFFWSLPITALFIVLRAQIVRVLLGSGHFDWNDTRLTAAAVALFVLSSVFQSMLLLFMRGFYSAGKTLQPFLVNTFSAIITIVAAYGLVKLFYISEGFHFFVTTLMKVDDLPASTVLMLPLAYSLGTIVNGLIHWVSFEKEFRGYTRLVGRTIFESVGSSILMGAVAYQGLDFFEKFFNTSTLLGIFLQGFTAGIVAIIFGISLLYVLKSQELMEVVKTLRAKIWKTKVIATDPEIV